MSKSETNPNQEARMFQTLSLIPYLDFVLVSYFDIRISDLHSF